MLIKIKKDIKGWAAMALYPFIFIEEKNINNKTLLNHEMIHLRQQKELLVLPFFVLYILEWFLKSIYYLDFKAMGKGYRNISFEREAYENEGNLNYLNNRTKFNWVKRILK